MTETQRKTYNHCIFCDIKATGIALTIVTATWQGGIVVNISSTALLNLYCPLSTCIVGNHDSYRSVTIVYWEIYCNIDIIRINIYILKYSVPNVDKRNKCTTWDYTIYI